MSRTRPTPAEKIARETPEERKAAGRREIQDALRETIGEFSLLLAESGSTDLLITDDFRPIVDAWRKALTPSRFVSSEVQPEAE
jgi:hypothetical protein